MPAPVLAAAKHAAELIAAVRTTSNAANHCRLSLRQYHAVVTSVLAADPDRQGVISSDRESLEDNAAWPLQLSTIHVLQTLFNETS